MPQKTIKPKEIYWLLFKIAFLEIMKRERKKIKIKADKKQNSLIKLFKSIKASIIKIEIITANIS